MQPGGGASNDGGSGGGGGNGQDQSSFKRSFDAGSGCNRLL